MEYLKSSFPSLQNLWATEEKKEKVDRIINIDDNKIMTLVSELNGLFPNKESGMQIKLPTLVSIGCQSSGKSFCLNRLARLDILPTGSSMTTRVPLNLELIPDKEARAEFGKYINGKFKVTRTIRLTLPDVQQSEKLMIKREIERKTIEIAGEGENIGFQEIIVKVYSPNVQHLSLIDLPGLISVNKNNDNDVKQQIEQLVESYIERDRTLVLCVMPARVDIETDSGLGFVSKYDPKFDRVIGLLTKPDLMNDNTDVKDYLVDAIPDTLKLKHGYYVIRNKFDQGSAINNPKLEDDYFINHKIYGEMKDRSKLGINNLSNDLNKILTDYVRTLLPDVLSEIIQEQTNINDKIIGLGAPLPEDTEGKASVIHQLIADFCKLFIECIEKRGTMINTGRQIKEIFVNYRQLIDETDPFSPEIYTDKYITDAIKDSEGNHMSSPNLTIEVLEHFLQDPERRPIKSLIGSSKICAKSVSNILITLVNKILECDKFKRFPKLVKRIKDDVLHRTITSHLSKVYKRIEDIILMEETYIWTDDPEFLNDLNEIFKVSKSNLGPDVVRSALLCYFKTIKKSIQNVIPKTIMYFLVSYIEKDITSSLFEHVGKLDPNDLLEETSDEAIRRNNLYKQKNKIDIARNKLEMYF